MSTAIKNVGEKQYSKSNSLVEIGPFMQPKTGLTARLLLVSIGLRYLFVSFSFPQFSELLLKHCINFHE